MTKIISCISGKGGVGKTMLTANLGAALVDMGVDVIVLDANLTTPNLGIHLGIPLFPVTFHDVLKGRATIYDAIYGHDTGLKIIPSGISVKDLKGADPRNISNAILDLLGTTDIVLMDCAAGLGREALSALESSDEVLLVTNPDLSSVTDVLKASKLAADLGIKTRGLVVNRITGRKHEMSIRDIRSMMPGIEILAEIPEDKKVHESISKSIPIVKYAPYSKVSQSIRRIASHISGREYKEQIPWYKRIFGF